MDTSIFAPVGTILVGVVAVVVAWRSYRLTRSKKLEEVYVLVRQALETANRMGGANETEWTAVNRANILITEAKHLSSIMMPRKINKYVDTLFDDLKEYRYNLELDLKAQNKDIVLRLIKTRPEKIFRKYMVI